MTDNKALDQIKQHINSNLQSPNSYPAHTQNYPSTIPMYASPFMNINTELSQPPIMKPILEHIMKPNINSAQKIGKELLSQKVVNLELLSDIEEPVNENIIYRQETCLVDENEIGIEGSVIQDVELVGELCGSVNQDVEQVVESRGSVNQVVELVGESVESLNQDVELVVESDEMINKIAEARVIIENIRLDIEPSIVVKNIRLDIEPSNIYIDWLMDLYGREEEREDNISLDDIIWVGKLLYSLDDN
uniref:Uncharacterized protein n=1 Tax=viral metagenome TaxID=1070528 RepID=A0A6C0EJW0_9ZZZZ